MRRASVVVVGGGVSGLAAAWELSGGARGPTESTPRVEVIEASDRFGGSLASATFARRVIDLGADGFLARRLEATTLARELGLEGQLEPIATSGAALFVRGALHELPSGLVLGVPTDFRALARFRGVGWRARLGARRDLLGAKRLHLGEDASIGEIVRAKLGRELSERLVEPMVGGIHAGRIDELSAKSVFPALFDAASRGGSLMRALRATGATSPGPRGEAATSGPALVTLTGAVASLAGTLERRLEERGVVLRSGVAASALRPTPGAYPWEVDTLNTTTTANAVIFATPAPTTGALLGSLDPAFDALRDVASAGAAIITFSIARDEVDLGGRGTGVLVPLNTPWRGADSHMVTAVTFLDRKWPHLAREHDVVLRAHVGRSDDARWTTMSDEDLTRRVEEELATILPRFASPLEALVQRWPNALAQYRVGHDLVVARARAACARLALALAGGAYDGVGVPACIGSGRRAARDVLDAILVAP